MTLFILIIFPSQEVLKDLIKEVDRREVQPDKNHCEFSYSYTSYQRFYSGVAEAAGRGTEVA